MLLPDTPPEGALHALHIAEAIRQRVQACTIPHRASPLGTVTVRHWLRDGVAAGPRRCVRPARRRRPATLQSEGRRARLRPAVGPHVGSGSEFLSRLASTPACSANIGRKRPERSRGQANA
ncbi:MAG: hypothetical protein CBARDCOR_3129 [uncultured Caballeronia sp.]|nr:MAG: hypothetical protein CBARDCOR_3129 [uncultured Caballeronia sp.]